MLRAEVIFFIAEMAADFNRVLLGCKLLHLVFPEADQGTLRACTGTGAAICHRNFVQNFKINVRKRQLQDLPRCFPVGDQRRKVCKIFCVFFQPCDRFFGGIRQQLDQNAARTRAGMIRIYKHAERAKRRNLLALGKIGGKVFGNFAALQCCHADIRLVLARVAHDGERSAPHRRADIQFSVCLFRHVRSRISDISAHIACAVRNGKHSLQRSVALDLQCDGIGLVFQHDAEDGSGTERAAERCGCRRARHMNADRFIDNGGGID